MPSSSTSILFVCLGNICRSPLAEGLFAHIAADRGLAHRFRIDSAGTGNWHVGSPPDSRMVRVARAGGVRLDSVARQVTPGDLEAFDLIVAMDRENRRSLERLQQKAGPGAGKAGPGAGDAGPGAARAGSGARIVLMRDYDPAPDSPDVPDPYFGGEAGFRDTYRIVERCCEGLIGTMEPA